MIASRRPRGNPPRRVHTEHQTAVSAIISEKARLLPWLTAVVLAFVVSACGSSDTAAIQETTRVSLTEGLDGPIPVIVDYSPTVSDVTGLMYLLAHPGVEVIAVTLPATGEAGCDLGVDVTLGILEMLGSSGVPVACDHDVPKDAGQWPSEFLAGSEGLLSGLPDTTATASDERAADLIAQVVSGADRPVLIYAVAPLTNLARVVTEHPDVISGIERIVIMGGALDVPGNVEGTSAEWNVWIDVAAADAVIESGVPVTLVPLDATNDVPIPPSYMEALEASVQTSAIKYLSGLVETFPAVTSGFFYMWDELAAAVTAGQQVVIMEEIIVSIDRDKGPGYGGLVRDSTGNLVQVATGVPDPEDFYSNVLTILAGASTEVPTARSDGPTLVVREETVPQNVTSASPPEEVLAFWLIHGAKGDIDRAGTVVAPDAPWVGFGSSADAFVEGSAPFNSFDVQVVCNSDANVASCEMTWIDEWIAAVPSLGSGELRVQAEVVEGVIVAFRQFGVSSDFGVAFDEHLAWLRNEHSDRFEDVCSVDASSIGCSELILATVTAWVESR